MWMFVRSWEMLGVVTEMGIHNGPSVRLPTTPKTELPDILNSSLSRVTELQPGLT